VERVADLEIGRYDFDDDLIETVSRGRQPAFKIYIAPLTAVVLGKGSKPEAELKMPNIRADGIPVLRREGGGCAVVLDAGNVIVSFALPVSGIKDNKRYFTRISGWLIESLKRAGVEGVRREGGSDLAMGDRKIGGSCIYRTNEILYYSTTLLVQADVFLMERYLRHPPREPDYRRGRTHRDFVGNINDGFTPESLSDDLKKVLNERETMIFDVSV
jgi:lipoate-protein ligase A